MHGASTAYAYSTQACVHNTHRWTDACLHVHSLSCRPVLSISIQILWLAVMFVVMLIVCERFFCPSIERLSEWLHLTPTLAGATLLAFGNGATDLFTQVWGMVRQTSSHRCGEWHDIPIHTGVGNRITDILTQVVNGVTDLFTQVWGGRVRALAM